MSTSTKESSIEQRKARRVPIAAHVDISDANTGRILGQLVNLSADGLMLHGPGCIAPGKVFQLRVPLETAGEVTDLLIGAESLWCSDANDSGAFWSGFQIIDISPEHRQILATIVSD